MIRNDTIFARATAPGRAGIMVVRLSGPRAIEIAETITSRVLPPRTAKYVSVKNDRGTVIDKGLAFVFPAPHSYTGEDSAELQLHGSLAVEQAVYTVLAQKGARLAEPGEFTLRAMHHEKLDLSQAEALGDLLSAETERQRDQARRQLDGALTRKIHEWRRNVLSLLTMLAVDIDFPDEGDVEAGAAARAIPILETLMNDLFDECARGHGAALIREGMQIVLIGEPNVGKSSLLNRLAGSDLAIVSDIPGTTRDIVETRLDLRGYLVRLVDTAGLRSQTADPLEQEGMRRTVRRAAEANLRIGVINATKVDFNVPRETFDRLRSDDIVVVNKADLVPALRRADITKKLKWNGPVIWTSSLSNDGIAPLLTALTDRLETLPASDGDGHLTNTRQIAAIRTAAEALERAGRNLPDRPELAAEDIRLAQRSFDRIVGAIDVEDVLGEIFSAFCIGK